MSTRPIEILLADDNEDDLFLLQECFAAESQANLMSVVNDGEEALAYLRRLDRYAAAPRPNLVLLDLNMPRKGGLEVLREMKRDPELRAIPTIILTTSRREDDVVQSYAAGACSVLTKPATFAKLQELVHQLAHYWARVVQVPSTES